MDTKKKGQKPDFAELYKEKMEKMRSPGKVDLKGQTKTDSSKAKEAMRQKPVLSSLNDKTQIKLDEAHFKDALDRMKQRGVRLRGKESEPSVDRMIKTIAEEDPSDESISDFDASSKDSDDSSTEILEEEKRAAERLLKDLQEKKEPTLGSRDISEFRKPYLSWLNKEKRTLNVRDYTTKDEAKERKKKHNYLNEKLEIDSDESEPSDASTSSSEVKTDPDDPFSKTPEGKEIMRKMKKIKVKPSCYNAEKKEWKKKMNDLNMDGPGFRPSLEGMSRSLMNTDPMEWCKLVKAQAESRNQTEWIGEVKDVESMWFRDICKASEKERRKSGNANDFED